MQPSRFKRDLLNLLQIRKQVECKRQARNLTSLHFQQVEVTSRGALKVRNRLRDRWNMSAARNCMDNTSMVRHTGSNTTRQGKARQSWPSAAALKGACSLESCKDKSRLSPEPNKLRRCTTKQQGKLHLSQQCCFSASGTQFLASTYYSWDYLGRPHFQEALHEWRHFQSIDSNPSTQLGYINLVPSGGWNAR